MDTSAIFARHTDNTAPPRFCDLPQRNRRHIQRFVLSFISHSFGNTVYDRVTHDSDSVSLQISWRSDPFKLFFTDDLCASADAI